MARAVHVDMRSTITRSGQGVPVNFSPLLAPHRKHGRISLRIERLPQQARFSQGSRNNDGSWSLATDELEDLTYHMPEGIREHSLAVRIVSLTGGNTLAVLDFPVAPGEQSPETAPAPASGSTDDQVRALREQLAQMKATLAERDAELAEVRKTAEDAANAPQTDSAAELEAVRIELHAEFEERLAALGAKAAADLKKQRDAWAVELSTRVEALSALAQKQVSETRETAERETQQALADAKAASQAGEVAVERVKSELHAKEVEHIAKAKSEWEAHEAKRLTAAKTEWQTDETKRFAKAKAEWQAEETDRAAKAKAEWQTEEAARIAKAKAEWHAEADKTIAEAATNQATNHAAEIEALRAQLKGEAEAALKAAEEEWKKSEAARLNSSRKHSSSAQEKDGAVALAAQRATLEQEAKASLEAERERWRKEEAERRTTAESTWRKETDKAVAAARAAASTAHTATKESAQNELREEMASLQSMLAERDLAIAQAHAAKDKAEHEAHEAAAAVQNKHMAEEAERLSAAQKQWQTEEAKRLTAAEARWRAEARVAATETQPQSASTADDATIDALRQKIDTLETTLADREAALTEAQEIIEQQARTAKPVRGAKSADEEWRSTAEAELREEYNNALAEARARYEAAESALAQVRIKNSDGGRTKQDLISTRGALAAREKELADLRAKFAPLQGQDPDSDASETEATTTAAAPGAPVAATAAAKTQFSNTFIGGVIAAACVLALLIIFYPTIQAALFPPAPAAKEAPQAKETNRLEPVVVEQKAALLRDTKLRAEPANASKAVASATKGFEVIVLESKGKWSLVRMGADPKAQQGWVLQSALSEVAAQPAAATPVATAK